MDIGQLDTTIPGRLNLGGMIVQQQDVASQDITNQARQQQMQQSAAAFPLQQQRAGLENLGLQQEQQMKQAMLQRQMGVRQIMADPNNLDNQGQLNRPKVLAALNQSGYGQEAMGLQKEFAENDKNQAMADYHKSLSTIKSDADLRSNAIQQLTVTGRTIGSLMDDFPEYFQDPTKVTSEKIQGDGKFQGRYQAMYPTLVQQGFGSQIFTPDQMNQMPQAGLNALRAVHDQTPDQAEKLKQLLAQEQMNSKERIAVMKGQSGAGSNLKIEQNQQQFDDRQWERAGKALNGLTAPSRTALGVATSNNMKADRALKIINNPDATPQDIQGLVNTDIAAVMKGGVPDEQLAKSTQYNNLKTSWAKLVETVTSNPSAANTPGVVNHLRGIVNELKDIDNQVIDRNAGINKNIFKRIATADPQRWNDLVSSTTQGAVGGATSPSETDPRRALAQKALADPAASPAHKAAARKILGLGQ
jgi:hypothetical protein